MSRYAGIDRMPCYHALSAFRRATVRRGAPLPPHMDVRRTNQRHTQPSALRKQQELVLEARSTQLSQSSPCHRCWCALEKSIEWSRRALVPNARATMGPSCPASRGVSENANLFCFTQNAAKRAKSEMSSRQSRGVLHNLSRAPFTICSTFI
jgi:hypothetical protein